MITLAEKRTEFLNRLENGGKPKTALECMIWWHEIFRDYVLIKITDKHIIYAMSPTTLKGNYVGVQSLRIGKTLNNSISMSYCIDSMKKLANAEFEED